MAKAVPFLMWLMALAAAAGEPTIVEVHADGRGASPEEMEALVAIPLEQAVTGLPGLERLSARCRAGECVLRLELKRAGDGLEQRIRNAAGDLPEWAEEPRIELVPGPPVVQLVVAGPELPLVELSSWSHALAARLSRLAGVAAVEIVGDVTLRSRVELDEERLARYGLTVVEVRRALDAAAADLPAGRIEVAGERFDVRFDASPKELEALIVATTADGGSVCLGDVGTVRQDTTPNGWVVLGRRSAVWLAVRPRPGPVSETVRSEALAAVVAEVGALHELGGEAYLVGSASETLSSLELSWWGRVWFPAGTEPSGALDALGEAVSEADAALAILPQAGVAIRLGVAADFDPLERLVAVPSSRVVRDGTPRRQLILRAPERGMLEPALEELQARLAKLSDLAVRVRGANTRPEVAIHLDAEAMAQLGLTHEAVRSQLGDVGDLAAVDDPSRLLLLTPEGELVALGTVASFSIRRTAVELLREGGQPAISIELSGSEELLPRALERLQAVELPVGVVLHERR